MHASANDKARVFRKAYLAEVEAAQLTVLDVGSAIVDGQSLSNRDVMTNPAWTLRGMDIEPGLNVDIAVAELGWDRLDLLVNNAGATGGALGTSILDMSFADWRRVMALNLDSVFLVTRAFAPGMKRRGWGRVINVSSSTFNF